MNKILLSLPLLALTLGACDAPDASEACPIDHAEQVQDRAIEFLYLSQYEWTGTLQAFADLSVKCDGIQDEKVAVSWSVYPEIIGSKMERVMGFGFSTMAQEKLINCF